MGNGRVRLLAGAVLAVTFVVGILVGFAADRALRRPEPQPARVGRPGPGPLARPRAFARGSPVAERLDLTEAQQTRIDSILAADREKSAALLAEIRPRLKARYDSTTAAIRAVLTPEQKAEFRRFRAERRRQLRERFESGMEGPAGSGGPR